MLALDDPRRRLPTSLLDARGGFVWWYVDAVDAHGDGLVLIWSWGLPFLPGDRRARREGHARRTADRPAINLALYKHGRPTSYHLLELAPESCRWDRDRWTLDTSTFAWTVHGSQGELRASLDLPIPGSADRLTGTLVLRGPAASATGLAAADLAHAWTPMLGPAHLSARFSAGSRHLLSYDGPAYHDRNGSRRPLEALGLDHWTWGRAIVGDELVVHYLNWPSGRADPLFVVVRAGPDGVLHHHHASEVRRIGPRRDAWGMRWWRRIEVDVDGERLVVEHDPPIDHSPFYLRAMTTTRWRGQVARGWSERCVPDRVDPDLLRPLVSMAVARELAPESIWLPLFVGPTDDRCARLLRSWIGGPLLRPEALR